MRRFFLSNKVFSLRDFVLLLIAGFLLSANLASAQTSVSAALGSATDDMEEVLATGAIDFDSSDLELTSEGAGIQIIGLRFPNLNIPQGAIILDARIQFTTDETGTDATTLTFQGEASDNSAAFSNQAFTVSSRPRSTASVSWSVAPWTVIQERGTNQRTPNLKPVVQEIVGRNGWQAGNALTVLVTGSGKRVAESHEGANSGSSGHAANQAATLIVEYTMPVTFSVRINDGNDDAEEHTSDGRMDLTSSDLELTEDPDQQYIGMKFNGINIPKGAVITNAYIQFSVDETNSGATSLIFRGQASDNPAAFTTAANNISARPVTNASVSWSPNPWMTLLQAGADQRTPDLSPVIQEIVDRAGWSPFNSMVIRVSGTGKRVAESFNVAAARAPQLVVRYYTTVRPVAPVGSFPVPKNAIWKYFDKGSLPAANWTALNYNDSLWDFGPAQLGYGDGDETTTIGFGGNANSKFTTSYFRHTFNVNSLSNIDSLQISLMRDDGAVVYLNGQEIVRSNMPAGPVAYATFASSTADGANESAYFSFMTGKEHLVQGTNVLAVEIHQDRANSSDISFNFEMVGRKNDRKIISAGETWSYYDSGNIPAENWFTENFSELFWKSGRSPLGYGNGNEATLVGFGGNAGVKYPATYFRKKFSMGDTAGYNSLLLRLRRDDGAVIYLNGAELLRSNMPAGVITNTTLAGTYIEGSEENEFIHYYIPKSLLRSGENTIAAEIHQSSLTSTDLAFDLELVLQEAAQALSPLGSNISCAVTGPGAKIGCFTSVPPTAQQPTFNYPKGTHTFQVLMKSLRDRYTGSTEQIPNGNDFTGFIPQNMTSSTKGVLSVNHENNPGGVSLVELEFNNAKKLWTVPSIAKVDFSTAATVKTERNCSGGVTPWGTVISSEETYTTGDVNTDGYADVGWNIEIDPVSKKIRDYDNDGKADKLWAVGRMSHENVVVAQDSITLYQGEDGGTGCVYKFIADSKARFDSGKLFVLKRDSPTATTGTWVQVPNTTKAERNSARDIAASLGGTNWGGVEDVEISPRNGMVYFTEKGRGETWRFRDNGMSVSGIERYLSNQNYPIVHEAGTAAESWNTGNDNLAFDGDGNLWVLQDGGRDHIWMVHHDHSPQNPKVELFATSPAGSEPTGITFSPDYRFMFLSFQNPSSTNTAVQKDAADSNVTFNASTTVVVARREHLGAGALAPQVELGADIVTCIGNPVTLKYVNPDATGIWENGSADTVRVITQSGMYRITVFANNGQTAQDSVRVSFIEPPQLNLGGERTICRGNSYIIDPGPQFNFFRWSDGSTSRTRVITEAGVYAVTAAGPNGCYVSDTLRINVIDAALPQPQLGSDREICAGSEAGLDAGEGYNSYLWSTGETSRTIRAAGAGEYWVRVRNAGGCEGYDTVRISASTALARLGNDRYICPGETTVLSAGGAFSEYRWSNNALTPDISVSAPGKYWLRAVNSIGCVSTDTIEVYERTVPSLDLGPDVELCNGCEIRLGVIEGYASYRWSTGDTSHSIVVKQPGTYSVTATNSFGCSSTDEITVLGTVSSVDETGGFSLSIYPNPFETRLDIGLELKDEAPVRMELFDMLGRKIAVPASGSFGKGKYSFSLDAGELPAGSGSYILKVKVGDTEQVHKLIRR